MPRGRQKDMSRKAEMNCHFGKDEEGSEKRKMDYALNVCFVLYIRQ